MMNPLKSKAKLGILTILSCAACIAHAQTSFRSPQDYYRSASSLYLEKKDESSLEDLDKGLARYPEDQKLQRLSDEIRMKKALQEAFKKKNNPQDENPKNPGKGKPKEDPNGQQPDENSQKSGKKPPNGNLDQVQNTGQPDDSENLPDDIILDALGEQEKKTKRKRMISDGRRNRGSKPKDW